MRVRKTQRRPRSRRSFLERLESRWLLAVDVGDAPVLGDDSGSGDDPTLVSGHVASDSIVDGLFLGRSSENHPGRNDDGVFEPEIDRQPKIK